MKQIIGPLFVLAFGLAAFGCWIANIVKLFHSSFDPLTGQVVLRIIGVALAPLGAVMGLI
jgi:hypothetical protein